MKGCMDYSKRDGNILCSYLWAELILNSLGAVGECFREGEGQGQK